MDRGSVSPLLARPALQRRLKLPYRRIPWPTDRIEREARTRLAAIAFDIEPAQPATEALCNRRRRLRGTPVAFLSDRPGFGLRVDGVANGFLGGLTTITLSTPSVRAEETTAQSSYP